MVLVRRDIWSLESGGPWDQYSLAYAKAVGVMQGRGATDPTSWSYQAAMHGTYRTPAEPDWNGCQHATWFFLPWHRMYIYWFERIVRSIIASEGGPDDWALPYWNYSKPSPSNTLPLAFRKATLPDGSANPLFVPDPHRDSTINAGGALPLSATSYSYAYSLTNFTWPPRPGFGGGQTPPVHFDSATGALENQPHNVIHDVVGGPTSGECDGGWMSDPNCAAQDPIFYLHHSNIDRLWVNWLYLGSGRANPTDPRWLNQSYNFFDEHGNSVTMKVSDVLTTAQLGYRYDDSPPGWGWWRRVPPMVRRVLPPEPVEKPEGGGVVAEHGPITLGPDPVTVNLEAPPALTKLVRSLHPKKGELAQNVDSQSRVLLTLSGIGFDQHPGVVYEIYVDLPEATSETDASTTPQFAGHVTFFGASHVHASEGAADEHHAAGLVHIYDITGLVEALDAHGQWSDKEVAVTFVPRGVSPPPDEAGVVKLSRAEPKSEAQIEKVALEVS